MVRRLSGGGRWIRTSGSAREEIEKSWYPVGVQLILYGFARPRDRWFADSPLEGDRLEPSLPLTRQHLSRAFGGCPSVIEKGSSSPGPASGLVYFSRGGGRRRPHRPDRCDTSVCGHDRICKRPGSASPG